jgi:phosphatidate cytidylyltransferase
MTRVLSGAVLIAFTIAVVWFAPVPLFDAVAFALLFAAVEELVALFAASGVDVPMWPTASAALLTLAAFADPITGRQRPLEVTLMAALIALAGVTMSRWRGTAGAIVTIAAALFPLLYLALPVAAIVEIRQRGGPAPLFLLMLTVIVSDTAQYYTGRLAGRRPLAPTMSPKKTVEGAIGGFIFGTAVFAALGAWWLPIVPMFMRVALGLGLVAVGIAGDLFESMLKRSAGVKDSSAIIPGHGGVLDRIDALLFAAPFYYVVLKYV